MAKLNNISSTCIGCLLFMLSCGKGHGQSIPSPLHTGTWVKFSVTKDGIYKIGYNQLRSAGFNMRTMDPKRLRLYGYTNGMLPQSNAAPRKEGLQEVAISVIGESDGVFNSTDYILFYGQNPDKKYYDINKKFIHYENHLYSDKSFYFLTLGDSEGKRIISRQDRGGTHPIINTYNTFIYHEKDNYNRLHSGRQWFGERFDPLDKLILSFDLPGLINNTPIQIVSGVMAESETPSSFQLMLNGVMVANQSIAPISGLRFSLKGRQRIDTFLISAPSLNKTAARQQFTYTFTSSNPSDAGVGYLDFLFVMLERRLSLYGDQTSFSSFASLTHSIGTFEIASFPKNGIIWDVTDPFTCINQTYTRKEGSAIFSTQTTYLKNFIVANTDPIRAPQFEGKVANQDLLTDLSTDLLIIAHPLFKEQADRLAHHRRTQQGIRVKVVSIDQVYNDYSGGKQDPTAIRDLVKKMYKNQLKHLLLFGRSSYDFRNLADIANNYNYVPTYESRNVLNPLETYSSDDYFAFLEPAEGEWVEDPELADHTLDIGVGRLPVKSPEEAKTVVDKLIAYDTDRRKREDWCKKIVFVADDGDRNIHQSNADILAEDIEKNHPYFDTQKIYLDAFKQVEKPSGQVSPEARKTLKRALEKGALIVNFVGHGSETIWLQERILDNSFIDEWKNDFAYPLLITATCEFGRHDDPGIISGGEKSLIKKGGGSIALVTATRLGRSSTNALLNQTFYNTLFNAIASDKQDSDLGTIFYKTKNNSVAPHFGISNRNFSLLGDPSMQLAIPKKQVVATYIKTMQGSDTLKAHSSVVIKGEVRSQGLKDTNFNGTVEVTLKDKPFLFHTLEDPIDKNIPFTFSVRSNTLFRGKASVADGAFELTFVMPQNTAYEVGPGKISLYAIGNDGQGDAIGGATHFSVGGREINVADDNTPPLIQLFINDNTFINGSITSPNIEFIAHLSDQNGINLASHGDDKSPVMLFDEEKVEDIGEYYSAEKDNFKKGTIRLPFTNVSPGNHVIKLMVWDVYNNGSSASLNFNIVRSQGIAIGNLFNYPNPCSTSTRIRFTHNRPGDHLKTALLLFDPLGKVIEESNYDLPNSPNTVDLPAWDKNSGTGTKLMGGNVYLLRVIVRSLSDRTTDQKLVRIIITP